MEDGCFYSSQPPQDQFHTRLAIELSSSATSALPASAQHIWRVHKAPSTRGRQGKLDPNRRLKVKIVREMRACLRCSMLRIPVSHRLSLLLSAIDHLKCSQDDICVPCGKLAEAALHVHQKRTLSFCGRVRTRLGELNLFEYCKTLSRLLKV
jgi:hypothetical protein